jgi:cobalt/nickel transport system permease protein
VALDIDRHAHIDSPIQRWDPRFKIISLLVLMFSIALVKSLALDIAGLIMAVGLLLISRIPLDFVFQGLKWIVLFLMPFFVILPVTYPGETEFHFLGLPFAMEGLRLSALIVIKAVAIVLIAYTIFGSRRFDINMIALQRLKCPPVVVQMILFAYRYIFLFMEEMERMDTAMKARGFVKKVDIYTLKQMGSFIATLLIRSFERTERIYKAMLSKGYQGEFHTLVEFKADTKDMVKTGVVLALAIGLFGMDMMAVFPKAELAWF